jgi:periplasmic divalent cation tolerance protein
VYLVKTRSGKFVVVLVTAPGLKVARRLTRSILRARLAACVNLVPGLESHFWWQGQLDKASEVLMVMKTTRRRLAALEALVLEEHPYDTAEFIALPIHAGSRRYLAWLEGSVLGR